MDFDGLKNIAYLMVAIVIIVIILVTLVRYLFEKLIVRIYKRINLEKTSLIIFSRAIILILFNLIVLWMFGFLDPELFTFSEAQTGLIILLIGLVIAIIVGLLSYLAIKAGYGKGYGSLASASLLDRGLTLVTLALLVGPSEDIFFIGFVQNALTPALGWGAIIFYLLLFVAYHYANVLSGIETKQEFLGTLPVRLIVSCLLGASFYLTGTLMWGMIVHNMVDSLSYLVLLVLSKPIPEQMRPAETEPDVSCATEIKVDKG